MEVDPVQAEGHSLAKPAEVGATETGAITENEAALTPMPVMEGRQAGRAPAQTVIEHGRRLVTGALYHHQ
jgi:hypothetical protein